MVIARRQSALFGDAEPQSALFRRMRLSSPGQTWRHLTEKRILVQTPHGKVHSVLIDSRKGALCDSQVAQNALFRYVAAPGRCGATTRQAAGHYGEWPNWANALEQPPASLRGGLRGGPPISVRSLASRKAALWGCRPHGEVHSVRRTSRKTAFCAPDLTERCSVRGCPHTECAFW